MRRLVFVIMLGIFFSGCTKDLTSLEQLSSFNSGKDLRANHTRMEICHYDKKTGTSKAIVIDKNAWPAHQKHGDVVGDCSVETVTICEQTWMLLNLDVDHYRNGDPIPQVTDPGEWASLTTGAWCYWYNDAANGPIYGKLYNWYAVNDPRGLAPAGWHVPTIDEWDALIYCVGGDYIAGGKLKETGIAHWLYPNVATNETGFTALGGNLRFNFGEFAAFSYVPGINGYWWTSSEYIFSSNIYGRYKAMYNDLTIVLNGIEDKGFGMSVRCIKNVSN